MDWQYQLGNTQSVTILLFFLWLNKRAVKTIIKSVLNDICSRQDDRNRNDKKK